MRQRRARRHRARRPGSGEPPRRVPVDSLGPLRSTRAPSATSTWAAANPRPRLPPVTRYTRSCKPRSMRPFCPGVNGSPRTNLADTVVRPDPGNKWGLKDKWGKWFKWVSSWERDGPGVLRRTRRAEAGRRKGGGPRRGGERGPRARSGPGGGGRLRPYRKAYPALGSRIDPRCPDAASANRIIAYVPGRWPVPSGGLSEYSYPDAATQVDTTGNNAPLLPDRPLLYTSVHHSCRGCSGELVVGDPVSHWLTACDRQN